jgi:hypothetical protein
MARISAKMIMIRKNIEYGNIKNVTVADFGNGTIAICSSKGDGYQGILMKSHEKKPIGEVGKKYDNSDEFNPELSIVFRNYDSFNVFYETVLEVKNEFEKTMDRISNTLNFGEAIQALKDGKLVARSGWNGKGMFIVKQIPSVIGIEIIPRMQSLPQSVKNVLIEREQPICYESQMLIINSLGRADSWVPSSSDCFAEDWQIIG